MTFVCRYTGAGAAADARHQQEDDRSAQGLVRFLGKGTRTRRHPQRSAIALFSFFFQQFIAAWKRVPSFARHLLLLLAQYLVLPSFFRGIYTFYWVLTLLGSEYLVLLGFL